MLVVLVLGCVVAMAVDVSIGPSSLRPLDALRVLLDAEAADRTSRIIVWNIRLPYAVMALLVGMALSVAGAEMQTILNNPLASPFTLGVAEAAALGAALAIVLNLAVPGLPAVWIVPGNAFLFAFGSVLLLQMLAKLRGTSPETLILFGIALVFTFNALVSVVQFLSSEEALQQLVFWTMGSLARSDWEKVRILAVVVGVVFPFSFTASWKMTALRLGEERARSFGVDVARLRFAALLRASLLAGTAVAFVGTIGFIGLVGPHIARLIVGEDHRYLLPASALTGALVMSLASVASKALVPGVVMPVSVVTALIGVPVFLSVILSRRDGA